MNKHVLASVAVLTFMGSTSANAADLAIGPAYKVPIVTPILPYSWTGFYAGLNAGGAFGHASEDQSLNAPNCDTAAGCNPLIALLSTGHDMRPSTFTAGLEVGYNYQIGSAVFGLEADIDYLRLHGSFSFGPMRVSTQTPAAASVSGSSTTDSLLTVRPRIGFAHDRLLAYVTGGLAVTNENFSEAITATGRRGFITGQYNVTASNNIGWVFGGGLEYGFTDRWSLKGEYLHLDFGNANSVTSVVNAPVAPPGGLTGSVLTSSLHLTADVVRAGLNYRFY